MIITDRDIKECKKIRFGKMIYKCEKCFSIVVATEGSNPNSGDYSTAKCSCGNRGKGTGRCINGVQRWDEIKGFFKITRRYGECQLDWEYEYKNRMNKKSTTQP